MEYSHHICSQKNSIWKCQKHTQSCTNASCSPEGYLEEVAVKYSNYTSTSLQANWRFPTYKHVGKAPPNNQHQEFEHNKTKPSKIQFSEETFMRTFLRTANLEQSSPHDSTPSLYRIVSAIRIVEAFHNEKKDEETTEYIPIFLHAHLSSVLGFKKH